MSRVGLFKLVGKCSCAVFAAVLFAACGGGGGAGSEACNAAGKIAGGDSCGDGQSSVALIVAEGGGRVAECTGAYVSTTAILTAAHCFDMRPSKVLVASSGYLRNGTVYFKHPLYDGSIGSPFDMAVLKVDQPIGAAPIPVLHSSSPEVGVDVVAYGYGLDQNGQEAISRIESGEAPLKATFSKFAGYYRGTATIVSTGEGSPCPGDSGGPVLAKNASGSYGIIGVTVSGPTGCSAESGTPVTLASTQSNGSVAFLAQHVPDLATN
jgi:hypothetical protein